jgi:hypothetical protein
MKHNPSEKKYKKVKVYLKNMELITILLSLWI